MPKRKSSRKKPITLRFQRENIFVFNSVKNFIVFLSKNKRLSKILLPKILPITSESYRSTGSILGKKLIKLGVTPLVYTSNLISYLSDEIAFLCEKREEGFFEFIAEVYKTPKHNEWSVPNIFIWSEPYFT